MQELSPKTIIVAVCLILIVILALTGCSSDYDLCIEREKSEYRQRNPKASYGEVINRQKDFELMCSKFKTK